MMARPPSRKGEGSDHEEGTPSHVASRCITMLKTLIIATQLLRIGIRRGADRLSPKMVGVRPAGARAAVIASAEGETHEKIPNTSQ